MGMLGRESCKLLHCRECGGSRESIRISDDDGNDASGYQETEGQPIK